MGGQLINVMFVLFIYIGAALAVFDLDTSRFEEGKRQFEVVQKNAMLPRYGQCWTNTVNSLVSGCKQLTDIEQSHMALGYLNCFLQVQGKRFYPCEPTDDIKICTISMSDGDSASYATFFTHTQNICYFLEAQIWHENTDRTVSHLVSTLEDIAQHLDWSSSLQQEIIQQQKISLEKQNLILDQASNLSSTINSSSNNIHHMLNDFKQSTHEQRQIINDIFDRISQLQSTVLGEFSWFYSLVYYVLAMIICYILTSTQRTSGSRFWLYFLMTVNAAIERLLVSISSDLSHIFIRISDTPHNQNEIVYSIHWMCRKFSAAVGLVIWVYCAVTYQDIHHNNNRLLTEIKHQNDELQKFIREWKKKRENLSSDSQKLTTELLANQNSSAESSDVESQDLDNSFTNLHSPVRNSTKASEKKPSDDTDDDSVSSFSTALTGKSEVTVVCSRSSGRSPSLQRELRDLHNSTPFKEISGNLQSWAMSGSYKGVQETGMAVPYGYFPARSIQNIQTAGDPALPRKYFLRQRGVTNTRDRHKSLH